MRMAVSLFNFTACVSQKQEKDSFVPPPHSWYEQLHGEWIAELWQYPAFLLGESFISD